MSQLAVSLTATGSITDLPAIAEAQTVLAEARAKLAEIKGIVAGPIETRRVAPRARKEIGRAHV